MLFRSTQRLKYALLMPAFRYRWEGLSSRTGQAPSMQSLLKLPRFVRAVPHLANFLKTQQTAHAAATSRSFRVLASKDVPRKVDVQAATLGGLKSVSSDIGSSKIAIPYTDLTVGGSGRTDRGVPDVS